MTASPKPGNFAGERALLDRIAALETAMKNLTNKTLNSVSIGSGGITVNGGKIVIASSGGIQLPLGGTITDANGNIIFSADTATGQRLSTPFLAVPLVAMWDGNDGAAFRTGGSVGAYAYQAQHCMTEVTLWNGLIPQVVHSRCLYSIDIGRLTGTTSTPTYRFYVNGSLVDTKTSAALVAPYTSPLADITGITSFGSQQVAVRVTMQSNISSTDYFSCTAWNAVMAGQ